MGKSRIRGTIVVVGAAIGLALPAAALACSIAVQHTAVGDADEVTVPIRHTGSRAAWKLDDRWYTMRPHLLQGPAVARDARRLTFMAYHSRAATFWTDDEDPATTCGSVNEPVYTQPKLRVRESSRAVFVTFVTRRAVPEGDGCRAVTMRFFAQTGDPVAGDGDGVPLLPDWLRNSCLGTAFGEARLKRPIGDRNLVLDWVPAAPKRGT